MTSHANLIAKEWVEVLACEGTGVLPCIPKTLWLGIIERGFFTRQHFIFDAEKDRYPPSGHKTDERSWRDLIQILGVRPLTDTIRA